MGNHVAINSIDLDSINNLSFGQITILPLLLFIFKQRIFDRHSSISKETVFLFVFKK